ncbi:MAG: glycosyl hydrolase 115 family protein [Lachnospiraceae bacterium]|nr:glycosyl hydrolase 115 family protein [Lachnospiraceae bacterium]
MDAVINQRTLKAQETVLICDTGEYAGVIRAAGYVALDMEKVFGIRPKIGHTPGAGLQIVFGTLGRSALLDEICKAYAADLSGLLGKRECYEILLLEQKQDAGKEPQEPAQYLVIAGSDKRGTIYGLFRFSRLLGVSPFVNWLSIMPGKREEFVFTSDMQIRSKEPSVRFRGFFINDEWPAFGTWVNKRYGGFNRQAYEGIFELLLRLGGNYLWPAMWSARFSEDGPGLESAKLADELGIVMGMSHHEPCLRHGEEYKYLRGKDSPYGDAWSFLSNREGITRFWRDGLLRSGGFENVITIGMRGEADSTILGKEATLAENIDLLRDVIKTQNALIKECVNEDLSKTPRMLALYKEVEPFFYGDETTQGLMEDEALSDVILMLCDDNFGNLRTVPDERMRKHSGGYGMYYHFDYHGHPVSYEWVNSSCLYKTWEEMCNAYEFGIRELWIVNVGDIFTNEYPLSFFLALACDFERWGSSHPDSPADFTHLLTEQLFGEAFSPEDTMRIAALLKDYTHIANNRRPEALDDQVYAPMAYRERERLDQKLSEMIETLDALKEKCPPEGYPAFYQLVYYPAMTNCNLQRMWLAVTYNHYLADIGAALTNAVGEKACALLARDRELIEELHEFADGKWYGMGLSKHIGFRRWNDEECKNPVICHLEPLSQGRLFCVIPETGDYTQGGDWSGHTLLLPDFIRYETTTAKIYLYNAGGEDGAFEVQTEDRFLQVETTHGVVKGCDMSTLTITLDPEVFCDMIRPQQICEGIVARRAEGRILILTETGRIEVRVPACIPSFEEDQAEGKQEDGSRGNVFFMADDYVSIGAESFVNMAASDRGRFAVLRDFGKQQAGVKAYPVTERFTPGKDSPFVEYKFISEREGACELTLHLAPTNPPFRDQKILFGLQVNEGPIRSCNIVPEGSRVTDEDPDWRQIALCNERRFTTGFECKRGRNRIRVYAQSPCFVLEKLVIRKEEAALQPSYLGPSETLRVGAKKAIDLICIKGG